MTSRVLSNWAGVSYFIIFFTAIFANFLVIQSIIENPVWTVQENNFMVRLGIMAFLVTAVFDVIVAWALSELYKPHPLISLSMLFRMVHAVIMAIGLFALIEVLQLDTVNDILRQVNRFNTIWLIGLFFFGIHLILFGILLPRPKWIGWLLMLAGTMYILDTTAHFILVDYIKYSSIFLALVAIPSIIGEMSLAVWLVARSGKRKSYKYVSR